MANKYSRFELKPYQSMYVDPQKVAVSQILRGRYDENKKQADLLERSVASLDVLDGDKDLKQAQIDNVNNSLSDIASTGAYEYAGSAISQSTTDFLSNEGLKAARQSHANWTKEQETIATLRANGHQVLFNEVPVTDETGAIVYDENGAPVMQNAAQTHRSHYQDPTTGEMITQVYQPKAEKQLDYSAKMSDLVADIQADPVKLRQAGLSKELLGQYLVHGEMLGEEKIKRITEGLQKVYMGSEEGIQQMRKLTQMDINPNTGQLHSAEEASQSILSQMTQIAMKQKGKGNLDYRENKMFWEMLKAQQTNQKNAVDLVSFRGDVHKNGSVVTPMALFDFDDDGIWDDSTYVYQGMGPRGTPIKKKVTLFQGDNYVFDNAQFEDAIKSCGEGNEACREEAIQMMYQNFENTIAAKGAGDFNSLSTAVIGANRDQYVGWLLHKHSDVRRQFSNDKDFLKALSSSMAQAQTTAEKIYPGTEAFAAEMNKSLQRGVFNMDGVAWMVRKKGGDYTTDRATAIEQLADIHGVKKGDIHKALANGSNLTFVGVNPGGAAPGSLILQLAGVDGTGPIQFEVQGPSSMENTFKDSHGVLNSLRNGNFGDEHDVIFSRDSEAGTVTINHVDYVFEVKKDTNGKIISQAMVPRAILKTYKTKANGAPDYKQQIGGIIGQEQGLQVIEKMFNSHMNALLNSNFQMSNLDASKFSSYQTQ